MKFDVTKLPLGEALVGFVLAAVAVTFVLAFAVGPKGGIEGEKTVTEPTSASEDAASGGEASGGGASSGAIAIAMGDNFFEPNAPTVAAGSAVTFDITNNGAAIHNMRVAGSDAAYNTDDDTVSDPDLFTPGATGKLVWTAPGQAGEILFHCDFHPIDMIGTITVQ